MSKKETQASDAEIKQPEYISELLLNGSAILKAKTKEELAEMVNEIPADCHYSVGAVGHCLEDGTYSLRVDLTENKK